MNLSNKHFKTHSTVESVWVFYSKQNIRKSLVTGGGLGESPILISFFFFSVLKLWMRMLTPHHVPCLWTQIRVLITWPVTFELPGCLSFTHISAFVLRVLQLNVLRTFSKASPIIWKFYSARLSRKSCGNNIFWDLIHCKWHVCCHNNWNPPGPDFFSLNFLYMFLFIDY